MVKNKSIMLIFAHPDDESFSVGGTITKYSGSSDINLICTTRGEAGQCGDPPVCLPEELGEQRTKELKCAAKVLGIKNVYFLGLRDGTLNKFTKKYLASLLIPILKRKKPDIIITFAPTGISGHDDHIAISKAATIAAKKYKKAALFYSTLPESFIEQLKKENLVKSAFRRPFKGTPDKKITNIVDIEKTLMKKIEALKCHQSQIKDRNKYISRMNHPKEYFVWVNKPKFTKTIKYNLYL